MKNLFKFLCIIGIILLSSCERPVAKKSLLPISEKAIKDTNSIYYNDFKNYPKDLSSLPIGIFDSDLGGLLILNNIINSDQFDNITGQMIPDGIADFSGENFQLFLDMANMPYNEYITENNTEFLKELSIKNTLFLMGTKYFNLSTDKKAFGSKSPVKMIISSCATANSYASKDINELIDTSNTNIKYIDIIDAQVNSFLNIKDIQENCSVGILAPSSVISADSYYEAINKNGIKAGEIHIYNQNTDALSNAILGDFNYVDSTAFTLRDSYKGPRIGNGDFNIDLTLIDRYNFNFDNNNILFTKENNNYTEIQLNSVENYIRFYLVSIIEKHRLSGNSYPIKSIILGNSLYYYFLETFKEVLEELINYRFNNEPIYKYSISKNFCFIDPSLEIAKQCYQTLLINKTLAYNLEDTKINAFLSTPSYDISVKNLNLNGDLSYTYKYNREINKEDMDTKEVSLSRRYLNPDVIQKIKSIIPHTYSLLQKTLN